MFPPTHTQTWQSVIQYAIPGAAAFVALIVIRSRIWTEGSSQQVSTDSPIEVRMGKQIPKESSGKTGFIFFAVFFTVVAVAIISTIVRAYSYDFDLNDVASIDVQRLSRSGMEPIGPTFTLADRQKVQQGMQHLTDVHPDKLGERDSHKEGHRITLHLNDGSIRCLDVFTRSGKRTILYHVVARARDGSGSDVGTFHAVAFHKWFDQEVLPSLDALSTAPSPEK